MTTTSTTTRLENGDRWSLIRQSDTNSLTGSVYVTFYVKGPPGLYGPFAESEEDEARDLIAEKAGVPVAVGQRTDDPPVEPIGPYAEDNDDA